METETKKEVSFDDHQPEATTTSSSQSPKVSNPSSSKKDNDNIDPTKLWTLRVVRGDDHHLLVPVQVFPEASVWELKVCISYAVGVDPDQITLKCSPAATLDDEGKKVIIGASGGKFTTLPGGISLRHMSRLGVRDLAVVFMQREQSKKKRLVVRGGVDPATAVSQAAAGIVVTAPLVAASDQDKRFSKPQSLVQVQMLPKRRYLSKQLVETLIEMASNPQGYSAAVGKHKAMDNNGSSSNSTNQPASSGSASSTSAGGGAAYQYFLERVDLGEDINAAVDESTGYNALQLSLLHARNPSLALLLLQERRSFHYPTTSAKVAGTDGDDSAAPTVAGAPTATFTLAADLRFQRRYPDNPLMFDEDSLPLLMCCDLMLDTELLKKAGESRSMGDFRRPSRTDPLSWPTFNTFCPSDSLRVCPIESALVFSKVFPRLIELLTPSLPVLRQNEKLMTRISVAVDTINSQYYHDKEGNDETTFGTPESRRAVLDAFKKLQEQK